MSYLLARGDGCDILNAIFSVVNVNKIYVIPATFLK